MNFPFYIAKRYLFAKKSQHVINLISGISLIGILTGTLSMIIVLSAMNGLDLFMTSLYSSFDPDIRITPARGKVFLPEDSLKHSLSGLPSIYAFSEVLEDDVLLMHGESQHFAVLKGVDENFLKVCRIDSMIRQGRYFSGKTSVNEGIIGIGVQQFLGMVDLSDPRISIYAPIKTSGMVSPENAFRRRNIQLSGVYDIEEESNTKYLIAPLGFVREILDREEGISALEISLRAEVSPDKAAKEIRELFGEEYKVQTLKEQKETFYKVATTEKWAIFFILAFILLICSFNIIGSLSMLIIEKQQDIANLRSLGASEKLISRIFLVEGWLISWFGCLGGLLLGGIFCWLQMQFGWIKIAAKGNFIFEAYPMALKFSDFLLTLVTVLAIGWITAWIPSRILVKKYLNHG